MTRPGLHAAKMSSPRLQRALQALQEFPEGLTTLDMIQKTGLCAINSIVSELRKNGFTIYCRHEGKTQDGASVYRYRLVGGV